MAKSRQTLASDLDLDSLKAPAGAASPQRFIHEQPARAASETPAPASEGLLKTRAIATTLYLLPADHTRLRVLASQRGLAAQTLLLDALDMLFAQEGQGPVERWETRRKVR